MKKIIKITAMLVSVTLAAANVSAQSKMTEQQKQEVKAKSEALKQKLNLTDEQSKSVDAINSTWFKGIADIRNSGESKLAKHQKLKSLNEQRNRQMKNVLTKEQFKIFKQDQKEMREELKQRRANRE
jgi:Spy/CpxP family protein refolding chaperone